MARSLVERRLILELLFEGLMAENRLSADAGIEAALDFFDQEPSAQRAALSGFASKKRDFLTTKKSKVEESIPLLDEEITFYTQEATKR